MKGEPVDWEALRFGDVIWLGATNSYMYIARGDLVAMAQEATTHDHGYWLTKVVSEMDGWEIKERLEDAND